MTKPAIEKQIRRDYADKIKEGDCILVSDVVQMVDDFLESRKLNVTEHWQPCVKVYFDWYKNKFGFEPDFKGANPKYLKEILGKLKKLAAENKLEWTEKVATVYIRKLMDAGYKDKWIKENFLLKNINDQYSKIRANERERKDDKKVGRITTSEITEYLNRRNT